MVLFLLVCSILAGAVMVVMVMMYPRPYIPPSISEDSERRYARAGDRFYRIKMGLCVASVLCLHLAKGIAEQRQQHQSSEVPGGGMTSRAAP